MSSTTADLPALPLPPAQRMMVQATVIVTALVMNAAAFAVTTILPQMQGAFAATQDEIAWVTTFNMLATAITLPLVGYVVPRFGRRLVMFWGIVTFTIATLLCGLATSLESLILWRIGQGISGAALIPLGQIILLDIHPRSRHGLVISIFGVANTAGPVLGPLAAGYLAENYSWRWGFHMLLPFGIVAAFATWLALPDDRNRSKHAAFDWLGFGALSVAIACVQYILSRGQRVDWFESSEMVALALIAGFAFYVFLAHVLTTPAPFVDLRLLKDRNYAVGIVLIVLFGMISFSPMVILPPLMQTHMGYPDTDVGVVVSWRGFGVSAGFFACILLNRVDERLLIAVGFCLQIWSGVWMMHFDLTTPLFDFAANAFLQGVTVGLVWSPISTLTFRTMPAERRAEAMGLFHLARSVATSFFIAVSVAEIVRATGTNYARLSEQISLSNKVLALPGSLGGWDTETLAGLATLAKEINRQSVMIGYLNTFVLYTVVAAAAVPFVLMIRRER